MTKKSLSNFAKYNLWANTRIVSVLRDTDTGLLEKEIVSSFPSIRKTLLHICDGQLVWLNRLNGISPPSFPSESFTGNMEAVFERLLESSKALDVFIAHQPASYFKQKLEYKTFAFGEATSVASDMIHHCLNHSTFHRGQLVTMGRQIGITKFQPMDYIHFIRSN